MNDEKKKGQPLAATGVATRVMRRGEGESPEAFAERVKAAGGDLGEGTLVSRTAEGEIPPSPPASPTKRRFDLDTTKDLERLVIDTYAEELAAIEASNRSGAIRAVRALLADRALFLSKGAEVQAPEVLVSNVAMYVKAPSTRIDTPPTKVRLRDNPEIRESIAARRARTKG